MKYVSALCMVSVMLLGTLPLYAQKVYQESGGYVMMEMENTESSLGQWVRKTNVSGYSGSGHLEFTGNSPSGGAVGTSLVYRFKINTAGTYRLHLRAHKRLDGAAQDHCNDAYVKMEGDFTSGGNAPLTWLQSHTKLYGGSSSGWAWASMLDKDHAKQAPTYSFKAGKEYKLTVSGRSQRFNIDRLVICQNSVETAAKAATTESSTTSGTVGVGSSVRHFDAVSNRNTGGAAIYSLDGRMVHAGSAHARMETAGVRLVKTRSGLQKHMAGVEK
jgi:hypothetical protein